jgi:hypothetical protein
MNSKQLDNFVCFEENNLLVEVSENSYNNSAVEFEELNATKSNYSSDHENTPALSRDKEIPCSSKAVMIESSEFLNKLEKLVDDKLKIITSELINKSSNTKTILVHVPPV